MNIITFIIFLVLFISFLLFITISKKISILNIFKVYSMNYFKGSLDNEKRKFSVLLLLFLGILPYSFGVLLFYSFRDVFLSIDSSLLFQLDIILLTIFCLFIGFDFKKDYKEDVKSELIATLMVNILLIVISVSFLLIASAIEVDEKCNGCSLIVTRDVFFAGYYGILSKILVMFFYSLKRVFLLSAK